MSMKKVIISFICCLVTVMLAVPVLAESRYGGNWSYGGHHDPNNWGAFSNYYHDYSNHWSSVSRASDSVGRTGYSGPHGTSTAFINTQFGETAYFDCGVY